MKHKFTPQEDYLLLQLVQKHGAYNWKYIASQIPNRNSRQCRERYRNYLNPSINHTPWTSEEDQQLKDLILKYGPQWSLIAKSFPNRTDVFLKNRWVNIQRKDKRQSLQKSTSYEVKISSPNNNTYNHINIPLN